MYQKIYNLWLENAFSDADLIEELKNIEKSDEEIADRFYKELDFGTAGLRGIIGAGTNRMNIYTVGRVTQALAQFVKSVTDNGKVAIAYDSRIKSLLFAQTAAHILASNEIKVYIYKELMPTPMLSYAVRYLKCDAGIVITASHNPAKYNGYKVYGSDGCQLSPDIADKIMNIMKSIDYFADIKFGDFDALLNNSQIEYINQDLINSYYDEVQKQSVCSKELDLSTVSVVYTPLHGTGNKPVREILKRIGISNVQVVKEQELPDGNFPTCPYPNPEIRQPFEPALKMAKNCDADLLLATDPDCDRVGIAVKNNDEFSLLSGNDVGVLLLNYILEQRASNGTLPKNPVAVKTIVTSELCVKIASEFNCKLIDVLTGFKFIGEQIAILENNNEENRYILGFEESYGYLPGSYVRDKDAVAASMLICEMAAYYKHNGLSLIEKLEQLYKKFGYYYNSQTSLTFEGQTGMEKMSKIMSSIRENAPRSFCGIKVKEVRDYLKQEKTELSTNNKEPLTLPKSNVMYFLLEDDSKIIFRPSGTEPKIKIYIETIGENKQVCISKNEDLLTDSITKMN